MFSFYIEGVKGICNQLSLTTKIDAAHPELRNYAESQGWWAADAEFNFAEVFSQEDHNPDCCLGKESLEKQEGKNIGFSFFSTLLMLLASPNSMSIVMPICLCVRKDGADASSETEPPARK